MLTLRDLDSNVHTVSVKNVEGKLRIVVSYDAEVPPSQLIYLHPLVILEKCTKTKPIPESAFVVECNEFDLNPGTLGTTLIGKEYGTDVPVFVGLTAGHCLIPGSEISADLPN
jgi:hypothetical protein